MIRFTLWDGNLFPQVSISYGLLGVFLLRLLKEGIRGMHRRSSSFLYALPHFMVPLVPTSQDSFFLFYDYFSFLPFYF
jgi:hypothetical protein